jgi:hypothetical protein
MRDFIIALSLFLGVIALGTLWGWFVVLAKELKDSLEK